MSIIPLILLCGCMPLAVDSRISTLDVPINQSITVSQKPTDVNLFKALPLNCTNIVHYCVKSDDCLNTTVCGLDIKNCTFKCIPASTNVMSYTESANEKVSKYQKPDNETHDAEKNQSTEAGTVVVLFLVAISIGAIISGILYYRGECKCKQELSSETVVLKDLTVS